MRERAAVPWDDSTIYSALPALSAIDSYRSVIFFWDLLSLNEECRLVFLIMVIYIYIY